MTKAAWITGRGTDQNLWEPSGFTTRDRYNSLFLDMPILLIPIDDLLENNHDADEFNLF